MCYFITIGVPTDLVSALDVFRREYHFEAHTNTSIKTVFGLQYETLTITEGGCSCSLYSPFEHDPGNRAEKLRAKYAKKGWSQRKIERAIADKAHASDHKFNGLHPGLRHNLSRMYAALRRLLILVHHYSGNIESESVSITSRRGISISDLLDNNDAIPEDVLLEIQE